MFPVSHAILLDPIFYRVKDEVPWTVNNMLIFSRSACVVKASGSSLSRANTPRSYFVHSFCEPVFFISHKIQMFFSCCYPERSFNVRSTNQRGVRYRRVGWYNRWDQCHPLIKSFSQTCPGLDTGVRTPSTSIDSCPSRTGVLNRPNM